MNTIESFKSIGKGRGEGSTKTILHPGEILRAELEARKLLKSNFAMEIKVYPSHFSDVLRGKRNINAALAIKLEKALGINAAYWIHLQGDYDLSLERGKLLTV